MSKMISTTVYLDEEMRERLKAIATATRVPFSTFVREGIDMMVEAENEGIANGTVLVRP